MMAKLTPRIVRPNNNIFFLRKTDTTAGGNNANKHYTANLLISKI